MISGSIDNCRIRIVGDGAGENVGDAPAGMSDAHLRDFYRLEAAIEIETQAGKLAYPEFIVDADVLVGGSVDDGGIGIVGDGAGEDVDGAAAGMRDMDERDFDGLEGAVEIEIQASELAHAEFVIDFDAGVDFFTGVAIGFEAVFRFE